MSLPSSELQAWLRSQFPEGVPSWEVTADSLALLSSVCRRHTRREEEARLELEGLEMARQEYTGEAERLHLCTQKSFTRRRYGMVRN